MRPPKRSRKVLIPDTIVIQLLIWIMFMATRTAKGIVTLKATGTSLSLDDVVVSENHAIFAIIGFQGNAAPASLKAGNKDMHKVIQRINSTETFGAAIYYKRIIRNGNTRNIKAVWASPIAARVMAVLTVSEPMLFFEGAGNIENTASPTTGTAASDLPVHNCFHLGGLISAGPDNDAVPTLSADWAAGQRDGTAGPPPAGNITLLEGYKTGRCIDAEEMDSSGATTRDWCNILASFMPYADWPATDGGGAEIEIGDDVLYNGVEYTITDVIREQGIPVALIELDNTLVTRSYYTDLVET